MKVRKLLSLLLVVAIAASMLLAGCGAQGGEAKPKIEGPQKATINLGSEPPQMNTILTTDNTSLTVIRHVFEGLMRLDKESKPIPGAAEKYELSKDGLTYTFHLRKNAKWSNGDPVTAKDFEFAWKMVLTPENAAEYAYMMYVIKGAQPFNAGEGKWEDVGIKVKDDYTLEVTMERPTPYFLDICSFGVLMPVNEKFYNSTKDGDKVAYGTEADKMIYNGPWVMTSWAHEDKLVLSKNPSYWDPKAVNLEEITMLMIKDSNTALNTFEAGEADMIGLKGDQVQKMKDSGYETGIYQDGATFYFEFNLTDKIVGNKNIRQALTYAVDRSTLIKNVFKNNSLPALSLTNPVINGEKKSFQEEVGALIKDNNSEEAKKLLAKGLEELGLKETPKLQMIIDDTDVAKRDGAAFQEYWKKNLGIDVEILSMPFKSRLQRMTDKDFQIVLAGWGPDYNDPMTFLDLFETGNGNNHTSYSSAEYDKILNEIRVETDKAKRFEKLRSLEKILMDDMPIGPLYFRSRDFVTQAWFKGVVRDAFQDINLYWAYIDNSKK